MNRSNVRLLDLPNEILLIILEKLDNTNVLYSLFGIKNERLHNLIQKKIFTNTLNFVSTLTDHSYSVSDSILDRFCLDILPKIHHNVNYLIVESSYMERILLAANYPYLSQLKLFNFNQDVASTYFTDRSFFQRNLKQQITDLVLICNEDIKKSSSNKSYTTDVYAHILTFFENLTHLSIVGPSMKQYKLLSLDDLPSTTFSSSSLTRLCIKISRFEDCLCLLDGRLKQLTTLIVVIYCIRDDSTIVHNMGDLPNLVCFSLTSDLIDAYDAQIVPLLRHMTHLKELNLNLSIDNRVTFVDGTHLYNEILIHMPQLHTFTFYIRTHSHIANSFNQISCDDIQQTFNKIGYKQVACSINYLGRDGISHVFSLPFSFDRLEFIGNTFPNIAFNYVYFLTAFDSVVFKHEFFIRVARSFPKLKKFRVANFVSQTFDLDTMQFTNDQSDSIVEFPFLTTLDILHVDIDYVEQFLNNTKTYMPYLTELRVNYNQLATVTEKFVRDATRLTCAKVKRLILNKTMVHSKDFYLYFSSL